MCKNYNEFEQTLRAYNDAIVNEVDPIKKQELITFKRAFLWENPIMYRIYKAVHNVALDSGSSVEEVVKNRNI